MLSNSREKFRFQWTSVIKLKEDIYSDFKRPVLSNCRVPRDTQISRGQCYRTPRRHPNFKGPALSNSMETLVFQGASVIEPRGEAPSAAPAAQNEPASKVTIRRQASAGPLTEVLHVLRLPRRSRLRCSKCCTCHAKRTGVKSNHPSPGFRRTSNRGAPCAAPATQIASEVLQVLHLPRKTNRRQK